MANYCRNKLTITGPSITLDVFETTVTSRHEKLDFETTVPMPEQLSGTQSPSPTTGLKAHLFKKRYGATDWYEWQILNWGCKWGPYQSVDVQKSKGTRGKGKLIYYFDTPWSPPSEWIRQTSKIFPILKFTNYCIEEGMGFKGTEVYINGKVIKNTIK